MNGFPTSSRFSRLDVIFLCAGIIFALFAATELLHNTSLHFINNSLCYTFLGCNAGFFGFDAIAHLFGGILWTVCITWVMQQRPKLRLFPNSFWKSALILLSLVALLHIAWELYEFSLDYLDFRIIGNPYDPNRLAQPSVADTVGDLSFGLLGSIICIGILKIFDHDVFERLRAM